MSSTNVSNHAYLQFAASIHRTIKGLGLPAPSSAPTPTGFPEIDGYFFVRWGGADSAAIIVPKSKGRMGNLHSHLDLSGHDGHVALPKRNGRVVCHFEPDLTKVSRVLALFVNASKRPVAALVRRLPADSQPASQAVDPIAQYVDSHPTAMEPAPADPIALWVDSQDPAASSYTDEDTEEALQALGLK